jgi:hypothetical protein
MPPPFACDLSALSADERARRSELGRRLADAVVERRELDNGYALRIEPGRVTLAEIGEWISLEQRCCRFLDFRLELAREGGAVWLSLTGEPAAKEFLRAELGR